VNGKRVNIASYLVKEGDVIELRGKAKDLGLVLEAAKSSEREVPDYIDADHGKMSANSCACRNWPRCLTPCRCNPAWLWNSTRAERQSPSSLPEKGEDASAC